MKRSEMRKANGVKKGTVIVTVDIGMTKNHGYCTAADGRSLRTFIFEDPRRGFDAL
ncbi:MAG: hypothetical protein ACLPX5_16610 [Dissulfurispiraceae bacterium]